MRALIRVRRRLLVGGPAARRHPTTGSTRSRSPVTSAPRPRWSGRAGWTPARSSPRPSPRVTARRSKDQDDVLAHLWIGNGFSQDDGVQHLRRQEGASCSRSTTSCPSSWPASATPRSARGSRSRRRPRRPSARPATPSSASPTRTRVLVIVDLVSKVLDEPEGEAVAGPRPGCPSRSSEDGIPTGFDFTDAPTPTDDLRRVQLIKGTGPRVEKGQTIAVRYLGQVFGGEKPFDENFSDDGTGAPTTFGIGTGPVIKGWDEAPRRRPGRLPGGPRGPAGARLRRRGQPGQRHQGERHAGVRDRHPRRCLNPVAGMAGSGHDGRARASDCSTC